jgi:hypothetical protein
MSKWAISGRRSATIGRALSKQLHLKILKIWTEKPAVADLINFVLICLTLKLGSSLSRDGGVSF